MYPLDPCKKYQVKRKSTLQATALFLAMIAGLLTPAADYSWQKPQAKVLPTGDLEWAPKPFVFEVGASVRYIDYENGDDANDGISKATPWKHHPWDKQFKGSKDSDAGVDTYVFKRGVSYRGALKMRQNGTPDNPIRLTSDPAWGEGEAVLCGSEPVSDWTQGTDHPEIPEGSKVWYADIRPKARSVWMVGGDGTITRIHLARTPNWTISDPEDVMSEWFTWKNDQWWLDGMKNQAHRVRQGGKEYQVGIDPDGLTGDMEQYRDATVWTEWGVVMGTPYPTRVVDVKPEQRALVYDGVFYNIWGQIKGQRYFLEDRPQFLDFPGEYWLDHTGAKGRLYVRLPGDVDPNTVRIEVAARNTLIDAAGLSHFRISGLTFRFGNTPWSYWGYPFGSADNEGVACIRSLGPTRDVRIANCVFEHTPRGIRMVGKKYAEHIDAVDIEDCVFREIDQNAAHIYSAKFPDARVGEVNFRRNYLRRVTLRAQKNIHCHAVYVQRLERGEFAGNVLERMYAGGIFIEGCKGSGDSGDAPLTRILIHHNKVTEPLLAACDWGGIEQNQGGPAYIYDNVVGNPGGLHYWKYLNQDPNKPPSGTPRFGFAYYIDGSFKKYLFNNIAWGTNNEQGSQYANCSGIQEIIGFENAIFNNTIYKFVLASRRQAPDAGRNKYLGNVWDDISQFVFRHAEEKGVVDANAQDAGKQEEVFDYRTMAYARNVFHDVSGKIGMFEATNVQYEKPEGFAAALEARGALADDVGIAADDPVLRDPAGHDFRPVERSTTVGMGVRHFVPWALYATVGEWHFTRNNRDPAEILDEHWYMTRYYEDRKTYKSTPRYPLTGVGIAADDYKNGVLENWTKGALSFDGKQQFARIPLSTFRTPVTVVTEEQKGKGGITKRTRTETTYAPELLETVAVTTQNVLIECYLKVAEGARSGLLAGRTTGDTGYALELSPAGSPRFTVKAEGTAATIDASRPIADGQWHHVLAELDRDAQMVRLYIDGREAVSESISLDPKASIDCEADFVVAKGLPCTIDFLRVCRGTLAQSHTTIEELYAWQFAGPFLLDFTGRSRDFTKTAAGAIDFE